MTKRYELEVEFTCEPAIIVVEGESLQDVWDRRFELAGEYAEPAAYEVHPQSVSEVES